MFFPSRPCIFSLVAPKKEKCIATEDAQILRGKVFLATPVIQQEKTFYYRLVQSEIALIKSCEKLFFSFSTSKIFDKVRISYCPVISCVVLCGGFEYKKNS